MLTKLRNMLQAKKGQALVEYGILVGAIAVVCLAATAILGHKANDLIATSAAILPGAHDDDTGPIVSGKLVATTTRAGDGGIILDATSPGSIAANYGLPQADIEALVLEAN